MAWQEVLNAEKEKKHELILSGNEISERISKAGLDLTIFNLTNLNYLNIHATVLASVPDEIQKLVNLQTLVLHSNKIEQLTSKVSQLAKLKVLDLSRNCLKTIPGEISELLQLTTLNVSNNQLESFPAFSKCNKLSVLELSNNKLQEFPDVCCANMTALSELHLSGNEIEVIPDKIGELSSLKVCVLNSNKVKIIPGELADCSKLKEVNLKDNPIADKRLYKLITQCHTKQVLDYVKQHCPRTKEANNKVAKKGKKGSNNRLNSESAPEIDAKECIYKISVRPFTNDTVKVIIKDDVKDVRPHIVTCVVQDLEFNEETFRKFIQLQTKLHDTVCDKRNVATIATHDWAKLGTGDLVYTALPPNELTIKPLNRIQGMTGAQLFGKLKAEAENLRKEKKRNVYSGIHKYLYLVEGKPKYPCLLNSGQEVISFPPITNSDTTKMSIDTKALFIEVTGATTQTVCRKIADTLLKEMLHLFGKPLVVQQVKHVDLDGNLKSVYPARNDLVFEQNASIFVDRETRVIA